MHALEGPKCKICNGDPSKFIGEEINALEGKMPGEMESLRLVSVELEACSNSGKRRDDIFNTRSGNRYSCIPDTVYATLKQYGAKLGYDRPGGPSVGFEICTTPSSGARLVNQLESWEEAFAKDKVYVTEDCGAHVHTDARDFCMKELAKLMMSYRAFQPALYRMIPKDRRRDIADAGPCARIVYTEALRDALLGLDTTRKVKTFLATRTAANPFTYDRHVGCNVAFSFNLHRTVEWRLPPGLTKAADMTGWARMFAKLMDWVRDINAETSRRLVRRGWNGASSTDKLKEILDSERCAQFIDLKQKECRVS